MSRLWSDFVDSVLEGHFQARPHEAVFAGRHEFDGRLPDWSRGGLESEADRLRSARTEALRFDPVELDDGERFERDYLVSHLDRELFWLEEARSPFRNPFFYVDALSPQVYVGRDYAPLADRMRAFTAYAERVPEATARIRENLRPPLPEAFVELGRSSFGGLVDYYRTDAPRAFRSVDAPDLRRDFDRAADEAASAMQELVRWLGAMERAPAEDHVLGESGLEAMLERTERVDVPIDRLEEVAREELARNRERLRRACDQYAPGVEVGECVRRLKREKPSRPPVEEARRLVRRMRRFVEEQEVATVPEGGEARVEVSPPYLRWNAALVDIPGPYEEGLPAVYYITPPDPGWSEEERLAYLPCRTDLLFISVHEVWPGHYLHFLHAHQASSPVARQFVSYGFAEGWAHYAEELCWEAGLGEGRPEVEVGLRGSALLRNVRLLAALGLHRGTTDMEQVETLFREEAYQDPASARQQAARGLFDPGYLNYTMGKLMIRKLRDDWTAERGGREGWRAFHDRLLSLGAPPVPLARKALMGDDDGSLF